MKVLIIKTSSLGDVIHTLPALTDAGNARRDVRFDWVVEEGFQEIPTWHPLVDKVIPVALRRWRKQLLPTIKSGEWQQFVKQLRTTKYDLVIDAQGLMKSAFLMCFTRGLRCGLDRHSAWEPLASLVYQRRYAVNPEQHAIVRVRQLFAQALNYPLAANELFDYGIPRAKLITTTPSEKYVVFLHGTTWATKHWPEVYWLALATQVIKTDMAIYLPWGNQAEHERAQRIAALAPEKIKVLPKLNLAQIANILAGAKAAVAVDTGLGHLAAALTVPTISIYGPTDPKQTGTLGMHQHHLTAKFTCSPCLQQTCTYTAASDVKPACFGMVPPQLVWEKLQGLLD